jgi:hypothetical protein
MPTGDEGSAVSDTEADEMEEHLGVSATPSSALSGPRPTELAAEQSNALGPSDLLSMGEAVVPEEGSPDPSPIFGHLTAPLV